MDRRILTPYGEVESIPPLATDMVSKIQVAYERLGQMSVYVWEEQVRLRGEAGVVVPTKWK